jgi:hypothetical protein
MAELVAEDTESARGIAEAASDLVGGEVISEEGAEGFVLAMEGALGGEEEGFGLLIRYLISLTYTHDCMILYKTR